MQLEEIDSFDSLLSQLEEEEIEKSHSQQESIVKEAGQGVIDYTDMVMENKTEEVVEAVHNLTDYYEAVLEKMRKDYNEDLKEIQNQSTESNSTDTEESSTDTEESSTDAEVS